MSTVLQTLMAKLTDLGIYCSNILQRYCLLGHRPYVIFFFNPFNSVERYRYMYANSIDPDKMADGPSHQGPHCLQFCFF